MVKNNVKIDQIRELYIRFFSGKNGLPFSRVRSCIKNGTYRVTLYDDDVKGFIIEHPMSIGRCRGVHIEYLVADPRYKSLGIGKKLLENSLKNTRNVTFFSLDCDTSLENYYNKFGFLRSEHVYVYRGKKYLLMIKYVKNVKGLDIRIKKNLSEPILAKVIKVGQEYIKLILLLVFMPEYIYLKRAS